MVNYVTIPSKAQFESDSTVMFAFRASDVTLGQIDQLLADYHQVAAPQKPDVLYYLYLGCRFWLRKININSTNKLPTGYQDPRSTLPTGPKVSGSERRLEAVMALHDVVQQTLMAQHGCNSQTNLLLQLANAYECDNHEFASDQQWIERYGGRADVLSVFMTDDGQRRRYKLRFRDNLAYRWSDSTENQGGYALYDTTGNTESEINDGKSHFVMTKNGRIYSGFEKENRHHGMDLVWFKHSSLVGGTAAAAAGRMQVVNGQVRHVINDSGHYRPQAMHMVNLLQRLALYGQNMGQVRVERISDNSVFPANEMLRRVNAWPDGQQGH